MRQMPRRNDDEFAEFVVARAPQLRRVAFLIVRDWQLAEDVVQTALVKVYVAWPRVREGSLDAYSRRAVVNTSISVVRKPRREVLTDVPPDTASRAEDVTEHQDLLDALRQLSPTQAAVIALRYLDDLSVADVAVLLEISEGTVKSHSSRAIDHLRKHFKTAMGPRSHHER
jgi:RNA polymerase sigma-70 factor (sigma-E family)